MLIKLLAEASFDRPGRVTGRAPSAGRHRFNETIDGTGAGIVQRNVVSDGQRCTDQRHDLWCLRQRPAPNGESRLVRVARLRRIGGRCHSEPRLQSHGTSQNAYSDPGTDLSVWLSALQVLQPHHQFCCICFIWWAVQDCLKTGFNLNFFYKGIYRGFQHYWKWLIVQIVPAIFDIDMNYWATCPLHSNHDNG